MKLSHACGQEGAHIVWNMKVNKCVHKSPPLIPTSAKRNHKISHSTAILSQLQLGLQNELFYGVLLSISIIHIIYFQILSVISSWYSWGHVSTLKICHVQVIFTRLNLNNPKTFNTYEMCQMELLH